MMLCLNNKLESNLILSLSCSVILQSVSRSSPSLTVLVYGLLLSLWGFFYLCKVLFSFFFSNLKVILQVVKITQNIMTEPL